MPHVCKTLQAALLHRKAAVLSMDVLKLASCHVGFAWQMASDECHSLPALSCPAFREAAGPASSIQGVGLDDVVMIKTRSCVMIRAFREELIHKVVASRLMERTCPRTVAYNTASKQKLVQSPCIDPLHVP